MRPAITETGITHLKARGSWESRLRGFPVVRQLGRIRSAVGRSREMVSGSLRRWHGRMAAGYRPLACANFDLNGSWLLSDGCALVMADDKNVGHEQEQDQGSRLSTGKIRTKSLMQFQKPTVPRSCGAGRSPIRWRENLRPGSPPAHFDLFRVSRQFQDEAGSKISLSADRIAVERNRQAGMSQSMAATAPVSADEERLRLALRNDPDLAEPCLCWTRRSPRSTGPRSNTF